MKKTRKLIINADDYGMSPLFNKGILELARKNILSSGSIMVKRKHIDAEIIKKLPKISVGLHLELKENDTVKEIEKQIKKFKNKFGCLPSHLDGHKHVHVANGNIQKTAYLAKKYSLPVRSESEQVRKFLKKNKIKTPDFYVSWHPSKIDELLQKISKTKGVTEMVCHPGYFDKNSKSSYNKEREAELKFLETRKFKEVIKKFQIISYDEF